MLLNIVKDSTNMLWGWGGSLKYVLVRDGQFRLTTPLAYTVFIHKTRPVHVYVIIGCLFLLQNTNFVIS